jgi:hypothetical protein
MWAIFWLVHKYFSAISTSAHWRGHSIICYCIIFIGLFYYQIICWVLGEYGTADGRYSASYIIGKLCDVAEAHLTDDTVKVCFHILALVFLVTYFGLFISFVLYTEV